MIKKARIIPLVPVDWGEEEQRDVTLLELTTTDGITGLGSAYTGTNAVKEALGTYQQNRALNSATDDERIMANSAVDMALWDIKGKQQNKPISDLLGTRHHDRILAYATLDVKITNAERGDQIEQDIRKILTLGFKAVKICIDFFGYRDGTKTEEEWDAFETAHLRHLRDIVGPDIRLMIDIFGSDPIWPNGYDWALGTARKLEALDFFWMEEPLPPRATDDFARLSQETDILITGGEDFVQLKDFEDQAQARALNVIQPDMTRMGGITPTHHIQRLAHEVGMDLVPHGWNTAVGCAADLQLMSTTPKDRLCMIEFMPTWHLMEPLVGDPFALDEAGRIKVPTGPGLGVALNQEMIEKREGVFGCEQGIIEVNFQ